MPTITVTPAARFGAMRWLNENESDRSSVVWRLVNKATLVESFPDGYTPETVAAAERLLPLFAEESLPAGEFLRRCGVLEAALAAGRYGEGLR